MACGRAAPGEYHAEALEVPIGALEHFSYCPRQSALIHVEQSFEDNEFTLRGRLAHQRVDEGETNTERGIRILRGVPLWSERLHLRGRADVIELRPEGPYPVEYKVGRPLGIHAQIQLCAQALCIEEMFGVPVTAGAIYYHAIRRREQVAFEPALRERTLRTIEAVRQQLNTRRLPPAANDGRCPKCSLINICLPHVVADPKRLRILQNSLFRPLPVRRDNA